MKIFFTITDVGAVVHVGGMPESRTYPFEIDDSDLPVAVQNYMREDDSNLYSQLSITFNKEKKT